MDARIDAVTADLAALADEASERFGRLTIEPLNWKPAPGSWSVAQCFDHLITTNELYFPIFRELAQGQTSPSFWQRYSPLSGFFGRFLIKIVDPDNPKKTKTISRAEPSASDIDGRIIERFVAHQRALIEHVRRIPAGIDRQATVITSPFLSLITYSLEDCLTILDLHGRRHSDQARRVTETDGFPSAGTS